MTLSHLYQKPLCLEPLDADPETNGKKSDHRIVISKPISVINNKCARQTRKVRPFPQSGKDWFIDQTWEEVYSAESAHEKASIFQKMLIAKLDEFFPEREMRIQSDDQPWISQKLKKLDRRRKRLYRKERRSVNWRKLDKLFKNGVKCAKADFYKQTVAELKLQKPGQWYQYLKKITSFDQLKNDKQIVDEISHLSDQQQAEAISEKFASIPNLYQPLKTEDINVPHFEEKEIPQFHPSQVWFALSLLDVKKSTVQCDFPARLIKLFAAYLAEPLTDIYNCGLRRCEYIQTYTSLKSAHLSPPKPLHS